MKQLLPFFDFGHGSLIVDSDGVLKYTTAPNKMYDHGENGIAYEGVHNRRVGYKLIDKWSAGNRPYISLTHSNLDIGLDNRVDMANSLYKDYREKYNCVYLSIHSNAGNGTGIEVWTSKGQTRSDKYADIFAEEVIKELPSINFRAGKTLDGDYDKEAQYYVLHWTKMPAFLVELMFFDNLNDWKYMQTEQYVEDMTTVLYNSLIRAEKELQW